MLLNAFYIKLTIINLPAALFNLSTKISLSIVACLVVPLYAVCLFEQSISVTQFSTLCFA